MTISNRLAGWYVQLCRFYLGGIVGTIVLATVLGLVGVEGKIGLQPYLYFGVVAALIVVCRLALVGYFTLKRAKANFEKYHNGGYVSYAFAFSVIHVIVSLIVLVIIGN